MLRKYNLLLIVVLSLFNSTSHSNEISTNKEYVSSSLEEIAEEMIHFNASLDSLSTTVSNLVPGADLESNL